MMWHELGKHLPARRSLGLRIFLSTGNLSRVYTSFFFYLFLIYYYYFFYKLTAGDRHQLLVTENKQIKIKKMDGYAQGRKPMWNMGLLHLQCSFYHICSYMSISAGIYFLLYVLIEVCIAICAMISGNPDWYETQNKTQLQDKGLTVFIIYSDVLCPGASLEPLRSEDKEVGLGSGIEA